MKIHSDPRTQFWIDLNIGISKWIHQVEQVILRVDWNSDSLEVKTWMETQGLAVGNQPILCYINFPMCGFQSLLSSVCYRIHKGVI